MLKEQKYKSATQRKFNFYSNAGFIKNLHQSLRIQLFIKTLNQSICKTNLRNIYLIYICPTHYIDENLKCRNNNIGTVFTHIVNAVSYTHLRAHETPEHLVCRL